MCKRNTTDPLVREFLDRYQINLLKLPRQGASVADFGTFRISPVFRHQATCGTYSKASCRYRSWKQEN